MSPDPRPVVAALIRLSDWLTQALEARYRMIWRHEAAGADEFLQAARDVEVLIASGSHGPDAAMIDALPALKAIVVHGVGYDSVDTAHAAARGIAVSNTPDVLTDDVADMAIALMLACARRIAVNDRWVRDGAWEEGRLPPMGRTASGKRYGILGMGRIGSAIARRLEGFGGQIAYHNRSRVDGSPYAYAPDPVSLARDCDILIVAVSGGEETRHIVDAKVIGALGADGMLINIGRGSCVDQSALVEALAAGRLAGAGLDVFEDEPHVPDALKAMEKVVLQPHMASATHETRRAMAQLVLDNVAAILAGEPLLTPV